MIIQPIYIPIPVEAVEVASFPAYLPGAILLAGLVLGGALIALASR